MCLAPSFGWCFYPNNLILLTQAVAMPGTNSNVLKEVTLNSFE